MPAKFRAIIADDEEALRTHLRQKLEQAWPELEICGEAADGMAALHLLSEVRPDLAFLDIRMPGLSGLEVARKMPEPCLVIFVTAHDRYAVEAFENEAVDYLLKPVTDARLEKTVTRLRQRLASERAQQQTTPAQMERLSLAVSRPRGDLQWIKAQHQDGIRLIPVSEVCYFKATDKYTTVKTREQEFLIRKSIKELSDELSPAQFWKIHRAAIVNVAAIAKVGRSLTGRYTLKLKELPEILTVSRAFSYLFKQM